MRTWILDDVRISCHEILSVGDLLPRESNVNVLGTVWTTTVHMRVRFSFPGETVSVGVRSQRVVLGATAVTAMALTELFDATRVP